jgi:hypothetical protein
LLAIALPRGAFAVVLALALAVVLALALAVVLALALALLVVIPEGDLLFASALFTTHYSLLHLL